MAISNANQPTKPVQIAQSRDEDQTFQPVGHREQLRELALDAEMLDKSIADLIAGSAVSDHSNTVNLWVLRYIVRKQSQSYRAREAVLLAPSPDQVDDVVAVTVSARTTLRQLLKKFGDRLLSFDAQRDQVLLECLGCEIVDSESVSVRVLVRGQ
jgi:hypothetical protein